MGSFKVKAIINKANGQMNFSLPKKQMPISLKKLMAKNPKVSRILKLKFEGLG